MREGCVLFTNTSLMNLAIESVKCCHPWDAEGKDFEFTGVPPHITVMFQLRVVEKRLEDLKRTVLVDVVQKITEAMDEREIGGGTLTEGRITRIRPFFFAA